MERIHLRDKPQEGTTNSTGKAKKAGPPPWQIEKYLYKEESKDDGGSSHCDPRLELALQNLSLDQDHDFIPHDDDYGYGHPVLGTTTDLYDSASSTSDLGTLAGGPSRGGAWAKNRLTKDQRRNLQSYRHNKYKMQVTNRAERDAFNTYRAKMKEYDKMPDSKYTAKWR